MKAQGVQAPQFRSGPLQVELGFWESIRRGSLIPRGVIAREIELDLDQTHAGWKLRGFGNQQAQFDVMPILRNVDAADVRVRLNILCLPAKESCDPQVQEFIEAKVQAGNLARRHRFLVTLGSSASAQALVADYAAQDIPWSQKTEWLGVQVSGGLQLPAVLLGGNSLTLATAESRWLAGDQTAGKLNVDIRMSGPAFATGAHVRTAVALSVRPQGWVLRGQDVELLSAASDPIPIGDFWGAIAPPSSAQDTLVSTAGIDEQSAQPLLRLWFPQLDLSLASQYVASALSDASAAGRWIKALGIEGDVSNLHVFADPEQGVGYAFSVANLVMQPHKGSPQADGIQGQVWGYPNGLSMRVNSSQTGLMFPDLYREGWRISNLVGALDGWFGSGYFGLQGRNIRGAIGNANVSGLFSLSRPDRQVLQRIGLNLVVDEVELEAARAFIPYKIPAELDTWLEYGPVAGQLHKVRFAYQGEVQVDPGELGRRVELAGYVEQGRLFYLRDWPQVDGVYAFVHVGGSVTRVRVDQGLSLGLDLAGSDLSLVDNGARVSGVLQSAGDGGDYLKFVRGSPLQDFMTFVEPEWTAAGKVQIAGPIRIPMNTPGEIEADLEFGFDGLDLTMPELRVATQALAGRGTFSLPSQLAGSFRGLVFDKPASIEVETPDNWITFNIDGLAVPADVYGLLDYDLGAPISGQFPFHATVRLPVSNENPGLGEQPVADAVPHIHVESLLQGLAVDLPGEFGKSTDQLSEFEADVQFYEEMQSVEWAYSNARGWFDYTDEIERGAIGVNAAPSREGLPAGPGNLLIGGHLAEVVLEEWIGEEDDDSTGFGLPVDWTIQDLSVDKLVVSELTFDDVVLQGTQRTDLITFEVASKDLTGLVEVPAEGPINLALEHLAVPVTEIAASPVTNPAPGFDSATSFPVEASQVVEYLVSTDTGRSLPAARVDIERLTLGHEPFGRWSFDLTPIEENGVTKTLVFERFATQVNGVKVSDGRVEWNLDTNVSRFIGEVGLDDLESTLPLWDYPAALKTSQAGFAAASHWPGSPLDIDMLTLQGEFDFRAEDGRFLEVDTGGGGLRMLSLVNFSKAAKRVSFDFSDVVGEGISFDTLTAKVTLDQGAMQFVERMRLRGSSGAYQVGGNVDLRNGILDNEMIVTLPVSSSLPWYGVYLALANPLAGLGVLVGERVLRKPLEQFSSAKFSVTGSLEDPQINFVSLWDQSMKEPITTESTIPSLSDEMHNTQSSATESAREG